jgi:pyruvate formate lyase activating enzyme
MKEALFYDKEGKKNVRCRLCPHLCGIGPGKEGICGARKNFEGVLNSLTYNRAVSINLDPVEKKPLYHFYPGRSILSVGTTGCNFKCGFCQNWEISQAKFTDISTQEITKETAYEMALSSGSIGIAYTYNEPLVNYEWVLETSKYFRKKGLRNVLVTNGYINKEPWKELIKYIDAANIDVKSFKGEFYKNICAGDLQTVLDNVKVFAGEGRHVEITNLLIPGENDSYELIGELVDWIAGLSRDIPLHFSRYFPQYKMHAPATGMDVLERAYNIAKKKLNYVYLGNINGSKYSQTFCPECGQQLISREGYYTKVTGIKNGRCFSCNNPVNIKMKG